MKYSTVPGLLGHPVYQDALLRTANRGDFRNIPGLYVFVLFARNDLINV